MGVHGSYRRKQIRHLCSRKPGGHMEGDHRQSRWSYVASPFRNFLQPFRPVINGVQCGHICEQRLGGTDITGGFFAADVLLTGLEREAQGRFASGIFGDADDTAGHEAFKFIACSEESGVGPAVTQWYAETFGALPTAMSAPNSPGGFNEREGEQNQWQQSFRRQRCEPVGRRNRNREWHRRCQDTGRARRETLSVNRNFSWLPTTTSIPSASARVRTTSIFCG